MSRRRCWPMARSNTRGASCGRSWSSPGARRVAFGWGVNVEVSRLPDRYERDVWGGEIRPIATWSSAGGAWYVSVNPIVDLELRAPGGALVRTGDDNLLRVRRDSCRPASSTTRASGRSAGWLPPDEQEHYLFEVINVLAVETREAQRRRRRGPHRRIERLRRQDDRRVPVARRTRLLLRVAGGAPAPPPLCLRKWLLSSALSAGERRALEVHRVDVEPLRHLAGLDLLPAVLEIGLALVLVVVGPLGEVHVAAAVVDVARHQPGARRDARVQRPARLVAVAVEAGAAQDRLHFGRRVQRVAVGGFEPMSWVGMPRSSPGRPAAGRTRRRRRWPGCGDASSSWVARAGSLERPARPLQSIRLASF